MRNTRPEIWSKKRRKKSSIPRPQRRNFNLWLASIPYHHLPLVAWPRPQLWVVRMLMTARLRLAEASTERVSILIYVVVMICWASAKIQVSVAAWEGLFLLGCTRVLFSFYFLSIDFDGSNLSSTSPSGRPASRLDRRIQKWMDFSSVYNRWAIYQQLSDSSIRSQWW